MQIIRNEINIFLPMMSRVTFQLFRCQFMIANKMILFLNFCCRLFLSMTKVKPKKMCKGFEGHERWTIFVKYKYLV